MKLKPVQFSYKFGTILEAKVLIRDFLWNETTGLPVDFYTAGEVEKKTEEVFYHVYRAYPTVPSPYYV